MTMLPRISTESIEDSNNNNSSNSSLTSRLDSADQTPMSRGKPINNISLRKKKPADNNTILSSSAKISRGLNNSLNSISRSSSQSITSLRQRIYADQLAEAKLYQSRPESASTNCQPAPIDPEPSITQSNVALILEKMHSDELAEFKKGTNEFTIVNEKLNLNAGPTPIIPNPPTLGGNKKPSCCSFISRLFQKKPKKLKPRINQPIAPMMSRAGA